MSSEYIYDRAAVRLKGTCREYMAIFVKSHSSNVDPFIPEWSLYSFVKTEDVLNAPLQYCYYCDDGMTRGINGRKITGEYDLTKWREAIEKASMIKDAFKFQIWFSEEKHSQSQPLQKLEKIKAFADKSELNLEIEIVQGNSAAACLLIDLNNPKHVDLVWDTTRDMTDIDSKDSHKRLMLPFNFLQRQVAERLFVLHGYDDKKRTSTTVLEHHSSYEMEETIYKFEFPVDIQPVYNETRFVVVNWLGRILSCYPERWFCLKLIELERKYPGTAESAYVKFKKLMKSLPVTSHEGMTIEVVASLSVEQRAEMTEYDLDRRDRLFDRLHKPEMYAVYTDSVKDHLQAMALSPYVECNLAISEMKLRKKTQIEQIAFDM